MTLDLRRTTHALGRIINDASRLFWCLLGCLLMTVVCSINVYASTADIETAIMNKNYEQARTMSLDLLKTKLKAQERIQVEYYLGLSQLRLNQAPQAKKAFEIVMSASDNQELHDRASLGIIEALYVQGFYKQALKQCQQLLYQSPRTSFKSLVYLKIARINLKLTEWSVAREYLQKILNEFPQSAEAPIAKNLMEEKEYFTVQVGSFIDQQKAEDLVDQLKSKGQYAYVVETQSAQDNKFYRVRVGQMTSLSEAKDLEIKLSGQGYPTLIYP